MRKLGAPEEQIARVRSQWEALQPPFEHTEVFPENISAWEVFMSLETQWEMPPAPRCTIPGPDIESFVRAFVAPPARRDTFQKVVLMLRIARDVLIKRFERERKAAAASAPRAPSTSRARGSRRG